MADVRAARALQRSARQGASLTWSETTMLRRAPRDFMRMAPVVLNPVPPPFGLSVAMLACLFPRYALTHQFWSEGQAAKFSTRDFARNWEWRRAALRSALATSLRHEGGDLRE